MSQKYFVSHALAGLCMIAGAASAQTVTVDASLASPDNVTTFNKISTAVASFATGTGANAGNAAENVINVAPGTPVLDKISADVEHPSAAMTIDGDLTIQGDGGLATLAGQPLSNEEQVIRVTTVPSMPSIAWRQPVTLTLRDLAVVPTDAAQLLLFVTKSPAGDVDATVNFENCVFTANDGSNTPIITTGQEEAPDLTASGVIALAPGGDAVWGYSHVDRGDLTMNFTNTVIASFSQAHEAHTSDGIIGFMQGATSDFINCFININEGCVFANIDGRAIQNPYGGYVNVNGTEANPVVFREIQGSAAIWNYSDTSGVTQPTACSVNYARFFNLTGNAIAEIAARGFIDSVTNTIIANSSDGIVLRADGALPPNGEATDTVTIDNVVIHNAGEGSVPGGVYTYGSSNRNMNITNSVFTGADMDDNGVTNNGTGVYNISDSTLSLEGANALALATAGTGVINVDSSVDNVEVNYVNMDDPFSPDFFQVVTSTVNDWTVY